jgi:hypothetical protein
VKGNGLASLSVEVLLVYFLFGAFGTLLRVILAPDLDAGLNRRTVIETLMGGIVGMILPVLGRLILPPVGIDLDKIAAAITPGVRMLMGGALICLISYSGSLTVGGLMKYFKPEGRPQS